MKKVYYSWEQIQGACLDLVRQINEDQFQPDYIVGLVRGGLTPAVLISQYMDVPMYTLKISLREHAEVETNLWMGEDALGTKEVARKNILVVDDINDSGATIAELKRDWMSCMVESNWTDVWHHNVRFAVLTDNLSSPEKVDYSVWEINKLETPCWIVHPWEEFWLPKVDF